VINGILVRSFDLKGKGRNCKENWRPAGGATQLEKHLPRAAGRQPLSPKALWNEAPSRYVK